MIWPSSYRWSGLATSLRVHMLAVLILYLIVVIAGFFKPGPTRKDMMMFELARAHVDMGLAQTKGYNVSTKWLTTTTPVRMDGHDVYVSAPPLYPMLYAAVYTLFDRQWRALRLTPAILGLLYLYACLALSLKYLRVVTDDIIVCDRP
jgi:hypothetical protein